MVVPTPFGIIGKRDRVTMLLRMAALGEGVVDITLKQVLGDHVSRARTSVRILALIAICVSVSVTSYLSGGKEDVHSFVSALRLGLECSKGVISQWGPVRHEWSTCCRPVTVPCVFITHRNPLMPWSKMYFLASPRFRLPSLNSSALVRSRSTQFMAAKAASHGVNALK